MTPLKMEDIIKWKRYLEREAFMVFVNTPQSNNGTPGRSQCPIEI